MIQSNIHSRRGHAARPAGAGFTLVELLVVIAIVAVLIALLLPAIGAARDSAKSVLCKARMRDVYMVCENYSNDNQDYLVSSSIWYSDPPYASAVRMALTQITPYFPPEMTTWGYDNSFKNCLLYCPSEPQIWQPGTTFPAATYYTDSMTAGNLINSGVACFWPNAFMGYGNIQFGATTARRRSATLPTMLYWIEAYGNDPWHIGYGDWLYVKYRHSAFEVANLFRVDGVVMGVRKSVENRFAGGYLLGYQNP